MKSTPGIPLLILALGLCLPAKTMAMGYPTLDTTSHWSIQDWGFSPGAGFYVQGAGKNVWTGPGQAVTKTAFYNLAVLGVRLGGREIPLANPDYLGEMDGGSYLVKYASFAVEAGLVITVVLYFHHNGEFETYAYFQGSAFPAGSGWELIMRIDYDLEESGNNIAEFLWNPLSEGASTSPPQGPLDASADGRLVYNPSSEGASYWSASAQEITVAYPPLARHEGAGIERAGFARILHASHPQFGMVLWGDESIGVDATFKVYASNDGSLNPQADPGTILQLTGEGSGRPRYAYAGRDQMLYLRLRVPADGIARFHSKLFQRPASRPLAVRVFQHPPAEMGGWTFNPDDLIRNTEAGGRTFRNALSDLTGAEDVSIQTAASGLPWLPYAGYTDPGQSVSQTDLHRLMVDYRGAVPANPGSVRDWQIDLFLVNWTLQGEPDAWEDMFDNGGADVNRLGREGAAVFWPALANGSALPGPQAALSALRGLGLALNMDPGWSNCPFTGYCWSDPTACGGVRCGLACPPGADGCAYRAHTCHNECTDGSIMSFSDVTRNTIRFNRQPAQGSDFSELDWYQRAPEAWVKPGRFGIAPVYGPLMPAFIPN